MTVARDPAIRMALQAMLAEGIADELQQVARERLENKTGWTDNERAEALKLAQAWARSKDPAWGTAIRKALGEEIPDDPIPPQRNAPASTSLLTRALEARPLLQEEQIPVASIAQDISREETDLMTPEYERELAIVSREMERPPYYFPDDTERLRKATALVAQGKVVYSSFGHYEVTGSKGTSYVIQDDVRECPCPQGQKAKSKWCYHLIATVIHKEVAIRIGPHEPSLFPPPKTAEERLATAPKESRQTTTTPQNDAQTVSTPEPATEAPRGPQEPRMATAPANDAFIPEPPRPQLPALPPSLPLRSITAIIADLSRPLPADCIATKPADRNSSTQIAYLHWQTVARILDTYAPGWHGLVTRIDVIGNACAITYRLTIPCAEGKVSREATGQEEEEVKGYGDSTSNAEAMAFKRAAAKFGVGLWLYDKSNDTTATALAKHFKDEKVKAVADLGKALTAKGFERQQALEWIKTRTGVTSVDQIPLSAVRSMLAYVAQEDD